MLTVFSPAKLNLTLRILSRRLDGYHNLCSCFLRLPYWEKMTIMKKPQGDRRDSVETYGATIIDDENILVKVLREFRGKGWNIPNVEIKLWKTTPPGAGLGSGSGNAAALISWIEGITGKKAKVEEKTAIGADVPFLASGYNCAIVGGIGEKVIVENVNFKYTFAKLILVPRWSCSTKEAFRLIDELVEYEGRREEEACMEALDVVSALNLGEKIGLLPNDFSSMLIKAHFGYKLFFECFERYGALAWGISGSGSSCFALFKEPSSAFLSAEELEGFDEIGTIIVME
ncbi:GHMP kinase [Thermovirga lienii DSM 17291]|uniref:4-diphosphocytidyl-2-C-methyl-D-erythritol kinase n=1 Tax=Thermovirga lienii (strain ATCC BAA-1197 / DSM 17291 / Cas60314) TaxID=580340 RepID=G7V586_THELD|nr:GHMP kinase [Thermovirga lienii]AER66869.1 GHMP kinase [Thermovirga lienii DSM 17291]